MASSNPTGFENLDIMLDWVCFCQADSGESIEFVPTNWYNLYWVLCEPFLPGKFLWGLLAGVNDSVRVLVSLFSPCLGQNKSRCGGTLSIPALVWLAQPRNGRS